MKNLLQLSFLPCSANCALLLARLWFGLTLLLNHGWGKLMNFSAMTGKIPDPLHLGGTPNMVLAVLCEVVCPFFIVIGFATRLSALLVALEMGIAFFMVHHHRLAMGPGSGELAFLYLGGFLVLLLGGAGKHSVDGA